MKPAREPRDPAPAPVPHGPPVPVFVQVCPACGHVVAAQRESRTHTWMLEHWQWAQRVILLCLTCGTEIEAEPEPALDATYATLVARCPRQDGEGLLPCDLLHVVRPSPPPEPKEA